MICLAPPRPLGYVRAERVAPASVGAVTAKQPTGADRLRRPLNRAVRRTLRGSSCGADIGMRRRRAFLLTVLGGLLGWPRFAVAQQAERTYRVGWLSTAALRTEPYNLAFVDRLREVGFVEGRNLVIEFRSAQGLLTASPSWPATLRSRTATSSFRPAPKGIWPRSSRPAGTRQSSWSQSTMTPLPPAISQAWRAQEGESPGYARYDERSRGTMSASTTAQPRALTTMGFTSISATWWRSAHAKSASAVRQRARAARSPGGRPR